MTNLVAALRQLLDEETVKMMEYQQAADQMHDPVFYAEARGRKVILDRLQKLLEVSASDAGNRKG